MDSATLEQVKLLVSALFAVPIEEITGETSADTVESWDSLQHLTLVLELERVFQVQLTPEEITEIVSVEAIANMVAAKVGPGCEV